MSNLTRRDLVLAAMAAADGAVHTPVQVQKLFFLIDENVAGAMGGKKFRFQPRDYGPFDPDVYREIEQLAGEGMSEVFTDPALPLKTYRLTPRGQSAGKEILESRIAPETADYLRRLSAWVRDLPFAELVSAIYQNYPTMKINGVFTSHR